MGARWPATDGTPLHYAPGTLEVDELGRAWPTLVKADRDPPPLRWLSPDP
jgi:hypothetical protein